MLSEGRITRTSSEASRSCTFSSSPQLPTGMTVLATWSILSISTSSLAAQMASTSGETRIKVRDALEPREEATMLAYAAGNSVGGMNIPHRRVARNASRVKRRDEIR